MFKDLARSIAPPVLWGLLSRLKNGRKQNVREYLCGEISIELPPNHLLPEYQRVHPKYDRFLPHLASHLTDGIVVDVGANCGDTVAAMVSVNSRPAYICIEADQEYFGFLQANVRRISEARHDARITLVQALAGSEVADVILLGTGGTKKAVPGKGKLQSKRLDQIVQQSEFDQVRLVKVDVDGFDYDVINSASGILTTTGSMVYFETNFSEEKQRNGYYETVRWMIDCGYVDWTFFDNYGGVMIRTQSATEIFALLDYLKDQVSGVTTKAIAYYDLLAVQSKDSEIVDAALKSYAK